jgi:hypothetical protein
LRYFIDNRKRPATKASIKLFSFLLISFPEKNPQIPIKLNPHVVKKTGGVASLFQRFAGTALAAAGRMCFPFLSFTVLFFNSQKPIWYLNLHGSAKTYASSNFPQRYITRPYFR